ncbi:MAG: sulfurtransferase TusA family protein [Planctomycetes bacterium]|nr:sulfurtransferase TusA family protein [Planctomycetota bacterium]
MTRQVDARGLSCPQPVILARQAIRAGEFPVEVLVDTRTSCDNVRRAMEMLGHTVAVAADGDDFKLKITR